jgi:hypothetical protein
VEELGEAAAGFATTRLTVIGRAGYWADGLRVGTVSLVVAEPAATSPSPSGSAPPGT